jgi:putative ABC transport system permease protein
MADWVTYVREQLNLAGVRPEWESEVIEDLAHQLEDAQKEAIALGKSDQEARACALLHITDWQELRRAIMGSKRGRVPALDHWIDQAEQAAVRRNRRWGLVSDLRRDALYGLRMMGKDPAFTALAILGLALGIGATTAIFSVMNAVILRPLPYRAPDRLVQIEEVIPKATPGPIPVSAPDVLDFAEQNRSFDGVAGFEAMQFELTGTGEPSQIRAARVGADLFPLLGVPPLLGRTFSSDEDQPGKRVMVLSYRLWQSRFGGDPNVLGRTVSLDRQPYTVIGVMPQSFDFPLRGLTSLSGAAMLWVPIAFSREELAQRGDNFNIGVVARLKPGVTLQQAAADAAAIAHRIQDTYPAEVRGDLDLGAIVTPLHERVVGRVKSLMYILLGAVGLILLIACANVANLLLARAVTRQKEIALRAALGAGRARLMRQLISESVLLALAGGTAGLAVAYWGSALLVALAPGDIPRIENVALDTQVLLFTMILSILTGMVFGCAPALAAWRTDLVENLKEGGRTSGGGAVHHRLRAALVVAEVSVALILLVGAGLLLRSFQRVRETEPGFQPERVLTMSVSLPHQSYRQPSQLRSFYRQLLERLRRLPGTRWAGMSTDLPMLGSWTRIFTADGFDPDANAPLNLCKHSVVYGDYFKTMGVPLISGRYFNDEDRVGSLQVIIVSDSIAKRYFAGRDPIGKRIKWGLPQAPNPWLTIVGVVGDVKQAGLDVVTQPHTYEPYTQGDDDLVSFAAGLKIVVRTDGDPIVMNSAVRAQVQELDKQLAVSDVQTMTEVVWKSIAQRRFDTFLMGLFAGAALLLSALGLYGVISYTVSQRVHEIGVRMALGAARRDVVKLVVRQGMTLTLVGVALGLAGAVGLSRFISSMLYDVPVSDPVTYVAVSLTLAGVALIASYIPSRRATKIDPLTALR